MKQSALVFLVGDQAATRLAVAWPALVGNRTARHLLRAHGICRDDGTLDPIAEKFVVAQAGRALSK